jgi:hypothetical protein
MDFDKDNIEEKAVEHVERLIADDDNPLSPEIVRMRSVGLEAFAKWAVAMVHYHRVSRALDPDRKLLQQAESHMSSMMTDMAVNKEKLMDYATKLAWQTHEHSCRCPLQRW